MEVERSIYNYGLPDFASMSADAATTPGRLLRAVEKEIELFEPRLRDVRITVAEPDSEKRAIRFNIDATLDLDPEPERIEFDSVLELTSGRISVNE